MALYDVSCVWYDKCVQHIRADVAVLGETGRLVGRARGRRSIGGESSTRDPGTLFVIRDPKSSRGVIGVSKRCRWNDFNIFLKNS